jgi:regulator of PEP synthase PpsR (kinase-PPPase family)
MSAAKEVLVLSDATGTTAEAVANSALIQFSDSGCKVRRFPFVRSLEQVEEIVDQGEESDRIVVFSFVSPTLCQQTSEVCSARGLPVIDLLSPLMGMLRDAFHREPEPNPAVYPFLPDHVFELAKAIEFTLDHDDGAGTDTLGEADLIILGVSRAGKTPTSIYLSCRKLKVANIPIFEGFQLPDEVRRARAPKVGFRVSIERQLRLRTERSSRLGAAIPRYADRRSVHSEIEYCDRLFRSVPGLVTLDVSNLAVEEIADWIARNVLG